ncbi:hypothetical protein D9V32_14700 [Mycetocola tolaasinivorans]|uniref:Uncharacterized protein n=1 Tax=Mycetocola tolaasinivorans TaxID=76635 RepID=A0A3L6ZZH3_9MICO|nr:hypothetical protein [Mycetocola tolaasinivorans]RLP73349.1 hypothetical protein D9V32_14700 [Mycetocola tolaasinivorans]
MRSVFTITATRFSWPIAIGVALVSLAIMIFWGLDQGQGSVIYSELGLFTSALGSPLMLILPLVPVLAGALPTATAISRRFVSQLWTRTSMKAWLVRHLLGTAVRVWAVFFVTFLLLYIFAFALWPNIQPEVLSPESYGLSADQVLGYARTSFSFSQMMVFGPGMFGVLFCALLALQCALYCALAQAALLLTGRILLGLTVPVALYFLQSILMALIGQPAFGLMYVFNPSGLVQGPIWQPVLVLLLLLGVTILASARVVRSRHDLASLA